MILSDTRIVVRQQAPCTLYIPALAWPGKPLPSFRWLAARDLTGNPRSVACLIVYGLGVGIQMSCDTFAVKVPFRPLLHIALQATSLPCVPRPLCTSRQGQSRGGVARVRDVQDLLTRMSG
jgi:hypothetical protein